MELFRIRTAISLSLLVFFVCTCTNLWAQKNNTNDNKFRQLGQELPTPNVYRTASGAPGSMEKKPLLITTILQTN